MKRPPDGTVSDYTLWMGGESILLTATGNIREQLAEHIQNQREYIARLTARLSRIEEAMKTDPPIRQVSLANLREEMGLGHYGD